jgi:hypothetical protein
LGFWFGCIAHSPVRVWLIVSPMIRSTSSSDSSFDPPGSRR